MSFNQSSQLCLGGLAVRLITLHTKPLAPHELLTPLGRLWRVGSIRSSELIFHFHREIQSLCELGRPQPCAPPVSYRILWYRLLVTTLCADQTTVLSVSFGTVI